VPEATIDRGAVFADGVDDVLAIFPENLAGAVLDAELIQQWTTIGDLTP
jgi:hypothetical protein